MIRHVWSVLCQTSSIDSVRNSISLFEVIEQVAILKGKEEATNAVGPFEFVSYWTRQDRATPERGTFRIVIRMPDGVEQVGQSTEVDLREFERVRVRGKVAALRVEETGRYEFEVQLETEDGWTSVASVPLEVDFVDSLPTVAG